MRTRTALLFALGAFLAVPAYAQHPGEAGHEGQPQGAPHEQARPPQANGGHPPPPPAARSNPKEKPEYEKLNNGKQDKTPHVSNDHWYGRPAPNDKRYHLDHPFPHGHFEKFGAEYHYNVVRVDVGAHRFWLPGGFYFEVASWEWATCANWCWNCGDDFVIYEDPDHPGWYLVYNLQTGQYVHVQYLGT